MTTSGVTTGLATVRDVITDALRELQIYGSSRQPNANDTTFCMNRLNWMLKEWQDDGVNLWRVQKTTINWLAATAEDDLDQGINDVLSLRYVPSAGLERELFRREIGEYNRLPNKTTPGVPSVYCVTNGVDGLRMRLWPVPVGATTLELSAARKIEDVTDPDETLDVPQQYTRTVTMNLAANIAPAFGKATDPNAIVTIREAARLYQLLRAADRPASYFLGPIGDPDYA